MRPIDADDLKEVWLKYCIKHMQNKKRKILKDHTEEMYRDGCCAIDSRPTIFLKGTILSYNDTKVGDRVVILGTVTDISESGVQTIRPDTDNEGYVSARKIEGEEDDPD